MSEHELWNELGNLYFMSGTYRQAAYAYNRSIQLDAGFGRPYCNLALTYVKQGRYAEAVQLYQRSIELLVDETEKAITWYRLGDVYRHLKDYRDAILAYQQADILQPELSQESKESDEILYGGSGESQPAEPSALEAKAKETEAAVQAAEESPEAAPEPITITETPLIAASLVMASVTATALLEEPAAPAAVTETEAVQQEISEQTGIETVAVLEGSQPEPVNEVIDTTESPEPLVEPFIEVVDVPEISEPMLEPEEAVFEPSAQVEASGESQLIGECPEPATRIEIVYDREELQPLEEIPAAAAVDETEDSRETISMPEMEAAVAETLSMLESPAPAAETISNAADPETTWIDDEYLVSNFDHETEVYIPDPSDEQPDIWLPLEPEPVDAPAQPEGSWGTANRMQLTATPARHARRLPGAMLRESWEPALPVAAPELELQIEDVGSEDVFIVPQEIPEMEAESEPELKPEAEPDPLQTSEELEEIEKEITKFRYVVQSNPRNASAWDTLGTLYKSARKYREAILAYQQAVAVDSSKAPYHHHLGILYAIEGREEDAMKAFQDVIEIDPNHGLANATLGGYYRKMGLEELAQRHIGKAMKNFYNSENEYNKACLEALCGNVEQSIELLKIALKNKQTYVDWVLRDPDLDSIRRDPRFKQLIADYVA
jgi:tetratricopeptide (TPR) repeat protein